MSDQKLHETPAWLVPARRQLAILLESKRAWMIIALCTVGMSFAEMGRVQELRQQVRFLSSSPRFSLAVVLGPLLIIAALWPLLVWRDEGWGKREYHWSLPVSRATHDLWRVFAGAVWLMAALAACALLGLMFSHLHNSNVWYKSDGSHVHFFPGVAFWVSFFVGPLVAYTLASVVPLAVRRPLEWMVVILAAIAVLGFISSVTGQHWLISWFDHLTNRVPYSLEGALSGGVSLEWSNFLSSSGWAINSQPPMREQLSTWLISVVLWLGIGVTGILLALRRRR